MRIQVVLKQNRIQLGQLTVLDDDAAVLFGPVPCLCKADNQEAAQHGNPARDSTRSFGDTPTGDYSIAELVTHPKGDTTLHTYRASPSALLDPQSGDALTAKTNGREGLMIHGGAPSANRGLRPTHGCVPPSGGAHKALIRPVPPLAPGSTSRTLSENQTLLGSQASA